MKDDERPTGELRWSGKTLLREVVVTSYYMNGRQKNQSVEWRPIPKWSEADA